MTSDRAQYFYEQAAAIDRHNDQRGAAAILEASAILGEILSDATAAEPQIFADMYSRLVFVADKYRLPDYVQHQLNALRVLAAGCRKRTVEVRTDQVAGAVRAICLLVFHFSNEPAPKELHEFYMPFPPLHYAQRRVNPKDIVPHVQATVVTVGEVETYANKHRRCTITCETEELGTIRVVLWDQWSDMQPILWPFATLNLIALQKLSGEQDLYSTTKESLVVLEPDFLVDATDIAECFQQNGPNPYLYLLKKFLCVEPSESILLGNISNFCFDELIADIDCDFDEVFARALRQKPLQVVALLHESPHVVTLLRDKARAYFGSVRRTLARMRYDAACTEPTFISSLYGLQGRLDLMLEYDADEYRKDVVELKSGSPPGVYTGLWRNHLAQVTCYNMLLDSCFEKRSGSSSILYLRAGDDGLRNAPNVIQLKQEVIALRNRLVAVERELANRRFHALKRITPASFGPAPGYTLRHIQEFATALAGTSSLERKYFYVFNSFVAREHWTGRIGNGDGEGSAGFAGLWRQSPAEKEREHNILAWLTLDDDSSDFARLHLTFRRTERTLQVSTFRTGDIVLLYPLESNGEAQPLRHQILKGSIRAVTPDTIVVSLRNKQLRTTYFGEYSHWVLEHDFMATGYKAMHESLYDFLRAPQAKRELLLGLRRPAFSSVATERYDDLTDEQHSLLQRAMGTRDYFLLQGPPGTGKTSRMLKSMVRFLHERTDEHIVVMAFTNRAVDEICEAIKRITPTVPFIRLGTKDSTDHSETVLTEVLGDGTIEELAGVIDRTRVIVSTVSSLLKNRELLGIKHCSTAIVDEASQIVEPQIVGLLAQFERCILIGDEKQLPSVVTQQECGLTIEEPELNAVGIHDLRMSLFERLLRLCTANGWDDAYGMISRQGRMHSVIQEFPNRSFYNGRLSCLSEWQHADGPALPTDDGSTPADLFARSRILFVPSDREANPKVHRQEAARTALLLDHIRRRYNGTMSPSTAGVITPYRAQIATIASLLPEDLRSVVTIDTVERYQGSERDIIILSLAANHPSQLRRLQSLTADGTVDRKLNVALTRARHQLVILGCPDVLSQEPIFRSLLDDIRARGGFIDPAVLDDL